MSEIVNKLVKPVVEIIDHIGEHIPKALAKGHHRVADHLHTVVKEARKTDERLAQEAGHLPKGHGSHAGHGHPGTDAAAAAAAGKPLDRFRSLWSRTFGSRHCKNDPVDVATGEMVLPVTDVSLPGALPLTLTRTHLSSYRRGVLFGPSWASLLDQRLELDADGVEFVSSDGMLLAYPAPTAEGPTYPVTGPRLPLTWSGEPNTPMLIGNSGTILTFDQARPHPERAGAIVLRLVRIEDRNSRAITVEYDDERALPSLITHHGGYRIAVDHHPTLPRITGYRLLDTEGPGTKTLLARYGYDDHGDLTEVVNSSGVPLRHTYDAEHRMTSWTDRNGNRFAYEYDAAGRVIRTGADNGLMSSTFAYSEDGRTTLYTDSLGHTTTCVHNEAYRLVQETDPLGNTTYQEWDAANQHLVAVTDPLGHTTRYTYDAHGSVASVEDPTGAVTGVTYNSLGLPVELTEASGAVWRSEYDERGNLLATVDPLGARTSYTYDAHGDLETVTTPLGAVQHCATDAAGLLVSVTDARGATTTAVRDAFGRIAEATDALGNTIHVGWTVEGLVSWLERSDGRRESWEFDAECHPVAHTDPGGRRVAQSPGQFDLLTGTTDAEGASYAFEHDTERRLVRVVNPAGDAWTYTYDPAGRLLEETDFDGRTIRYTYDAAGRIVSRVNTAGDTLTFTRDALGRLTSSTADDEVTTYEYDIAGNLVRARNDTSELRRAYDPVGRLLSETVDGRTVRVEYDAMGHPVRRTTPAGTVSAFSYDETGLPTAFDMAGHRIAFGFDALGRETSRELGRGLRLHQTWDGTNRLTAQHLTREGTEQPLQFRGYTYRADDFLTEIDDLTAGARRLNLTASGRVAAVTARDWSERYAYDALGNLTHAETPLTETPDDAARTFTGTVLTRSGRTRYRYDAHGRVIRATTRLLSGGRRVHHYRWNAQDQLTETITPDGTVWRYTYDPAGRRVAKHRLDASGEVVQRLTFTWFNTTLAEQTDGTGRSVTFEYLPETCVPLAQLTAGTDFHAVLTDPVGTATELVSPDGAIAWQHRTTLWGEPLPGGPTATADCPLRFPGQYADPETGWHYNFFRHYDPSTARYTTPDPLGLEPAPNPSAYVPNPTAQADPLGLGTQYRKLPGWTDDGNPVDPTWGGRVTHTTGHKGRPEGVVAEIHQDMLGQITGPQLAGSRIPGWQDGIGLERTHLLAASLGGSNKDVENFMAVHARANAPVMYFYERQVAKAVQDGHVVTYKVTPLYHKPTDTRPHSIAIEATSEKGFKFTPYHADAKTRRALRKDPDKHTNRIVIPNAADSCI
ncbi:DUF6531 domain-containing protein [Streptomyces sp. NPDC101152]|uniref:DUF6531 domain-containing protein n=1 Tax=Streptomyces sp. NPDC101152 TaxID=3366116 RepID=UPI00381AFC92